MGRRRRAERTHGLGGGRRGAGLADRLVAATLAAQLAFIALATTATAPTPAHATAPPAQDPSRAAAIRLAGQVVDQDTGIGVPGAVVALRRLGPAETPPREAVSAVTDTVGHFAIAQVPAGTYQLTVTHLAYGSHQERLDLAAGEDLEIRIDVSSSAITLEPIVVNAARERLRNRARGTAQRVVTAEQLAPVAQTGNHLVNALAQLVPGMRVRSGRSQPGELVCLEFRSPASLSGGGCMEPVVVVDNVRQANGLVTLNTLPISDVRRVEALPPGEAGLCFGTEAGFGALLIETIAGTDPSFGSSRSFAGTYSWTREPEPYGWSRVLVTAFAANVGALSAGYAVSSRCLFFDGLTRHFSKGHCGTLGNSGARLALYGAPQLFVGYAVRRAGRTSLSQGSAWKNGLAGAVLSVPGIVLALTSEEDGFSGSKAIGIVMATAAAPAAAALADRLFRRIIP